MGSKEWKTYLTLSNYLSNYLSIYLSIYLSKKTSYIFVNFYGVWDWKTPNVSVLHFLLNNCYCPRSFFWQPFRHFWIDVWSFCHCSVIFWRYFGRFLGQGHFLTIFWSSTYVPNCLAIEQSGYLAPITAGMIPIACPVHITIKHIYNYLLVGFTSFLNRPQHQQHKKSTSGFGCLNGENSWLTSGFFGVPNGTIFPDDAPGTCSHFPQCSREVPV